MTKSSAVNGNTQSTMREKRAFYPGLDGLRAVAFLMVFCNHYYTIALGWRIFDWGWVGVDLFFVLSGFLITGILYDSLHRPNYFRNFYIRRALRIFPLFYGFWIVVVLLTPVLHFSFNRYNLALVAYVGNFFIPKLAMTGRVDLFNLAYRSLRHAGGTSYLSITHLWTLCVEEQFYLVWPAVIYFVRSGKNLLRICLAVIAAEPFLRWAYFLHHPAEAASAGIYGNSFFRMDTLLLGAAIALWVRIEPPKQGNLRRIAWTSVGGGILAFVLGFHFLHGSNGGTATNEMTSTFGFTLIAIVSGGLMLLAIDPAGRFSRWLQVRPLMFLGRISYGLYFFHELGGVHFYLLSLQLRPRGLAWIVPPLAFVVALVLAVVSFRFFESPFLSLKEKWTTR